MFVEKLTENPKSHFRENSNNVKTIHAKKFESFSKTRKFSLHWILINIIQVKSQTIHRKFT